MDYPDFGEAYEEAESHYTEQYHQGLATGGWCEENSEDFVPWLVRTLKKQTDNLAAAVVDAHDYRYWKAIWFILSFNPNFAFNFDNRDEAGNGRADELGGDVLQEAAADQVKVKKALKLYLTAAAARARAIGSSAYAAFTKLLVGVEFTNLDLDDHTNEAGTRAVEHRAAIRQLWADNEVETFRNLQKPIPAPAPKKAK